MVTKEVFPSRLKALREAIGLSQGEFAKALGVARASISYYEGGQRLPDIDFLDRVYQLTGCTVCYLMGYDANMGVHSSVISAHTGLNDEAVEALGYFDQASINFILASDSFSRMSSVLTMLTDPKICDEFFDDEESLEFAFYQVQNYARKLAVEMHGNEILRQEKDMEREHDPNYYDIEREITDQLKNVRKTIALIGNEKVKYAKGSVLVWPGDSSWITDEDRKKAETDPITRFRLRLQALEQTLQGDGTRLKNGE